MQKMISSANVFLSSYSLNSLNIKKKNATSMDKIFEKNSSFHVKKYTTGKVRFLFSRKLLLVLTKFYFWEEDWALGYTSMKF